jgi:hypothetical protein
MLWIDRRELKFFEPGAEIAESSYVRTNCRRLAAEVVRAIAEHCRLDPAQAKRAAFRVGPQSPDWFALKWMGAAIAVLVPAGAVTGLLVAEADDRGPAALGLSIAGLVFGALFGFVVGRIVAACRK